MHVLFVWIPGLTNHLIDAMIVRECLALIVLESGVMICRIVSFNVRCVSPRSWENNCTKSGKTSQVTEAITNLEIVQQPLLNYLHDVATVDDLHLFTRWFYLCLWYKDDPNLA